MKKNPKKTKTRNFVAKHAREFSKAKVHRDRKNDYKRSKKHPDQDGD